MDGPVVDALRNPAESLFVQRLQDRRTDSMLTNLPPAAISLQQLLNVFNKLREADVLKSHSASSLFYSLLPSLPPHFLPHVYLFFCPILALFLPYLLISFLPVLRNLSFCTSSLSSLPPHLHPYLILSLLHYFIIYFLTLSLHPLSSSRFLPSLRRLSFTTSNLFLLFLAYLLISFLNSSCPSFIPPLLPYPLIPFFTPSHPALFIHLLLFSFPALSFPCLPYSSLPYFLISFLIFSFPSYLIFSFGTSTFPKHKPPFSFLTSSFPCPLSSFLTSS